MEKKRISEHWEGIYATKESNELGWYQEIPITSLEWIEKLNLPLSARIIDVGGGDSRLVDILLDKGYRNITVLDISQNALQRAKQRLGERAGLVEWICTDVNCFEGKVTYDLWHDRACFHFLLGETDRERYRDIVSSALDYSGHLILGAFSKEGPKMCSGLDIRQSDKNELQTLFERFQLLETGYHKHYTPSGNLQNYIFCNFRKI